MKVKQDHTSDFVSDTEVAKILNLSVEFVRRDRITRRLLPFVRLGRCVRYHLPTVIAAVNNKQIGGDAIKVGEA